MKTMILKKQELDKLPAETQKHILDIIKDREISFRSLKDRMKNLKYREINYRNDTNVIIRLSFGKAESIIFENWQKTSGEQWGNCSGTDYTFRIGTKYIRMDCRHYNYDQMDWNNSFYISAQKLAEILDLLEEAERETCEVDSSRLYIIATQRVEALYSPY